jgi:hypothetical protein
VKKTASAETISIYRCPFPNVPILSTPCYIWHESSA